MIENDTSASVATRTWPDGSSEAAKIIRSNMWAGNPIGDPESWPEALRVTVDLLLSCQFPMVLLWGPDLIQIYNDGYLRIMGSKHPGGMGQQTLECWPEVWQFNRPIYARVWQGEALTLEDQLFPITRHGFLEEAYFTLCYSPVRNGEASICGVLVTVIETTARVVSTRSREASEAALRASEERLRLALSAANGIGIWDWDVVEDCLYADGKFAAFYGIDPERAANGARLSEVTRNIHPDDRERIAQAIAIALKRGGEYAEEHRIVQENGKTRWVSAQGHVLLSPDGKAIRFPGVATDITIRNERKKFSIPLKSWSQSVVLPPASRMRSTTLWNLSRIFCISPAPPTRTFRRRFRATSTWHKRNSAAYPRSPARPCASTNSPRNRFASPAKISSAERSRSTRGGS